MYRWDTDYLNKLLLEYEKKASNADSEEQMQEFDRTVVSIEDILEHHATYFEDIDNLADVEYQEEAPDLRIIINSDKRIFKKYRAYTDFFRLFVNSLDGLVVQSKPNLPKIKVNKNHILTISRFFYGQFKGEIFNTFELIYDSLPTHLEFRKSKQYDTMFAQTFSVYGTNESYYDVGLAHNAQDYITLFHEFGHGIANVMNSEVMWDYNRYCLIEVDTLFWELVGQDYISDNLRLQRDAHRISLINLKEYLYGADLMCSKQELYGNFRGKDLANKRLLRNYLKKEIGYDNIAANHTLYSLAKETVHYIISYLMAVELYWIYKSDKKTAIELLIKIIKCKGLSPDGYLNYIKSLGIVPGEHIKEYVDMLISRGEELGYGKELYYRH